MHMNTICLLLVHVTLVIGNPFNNGLDNSKVREYWKESRASRDELERNLLNSKAVLDCSFLDQGMVDEIHGYQDIVNNIIELFTTGEFKGKAFEFVAYVADTFGPRMTGSQALEDVIDYFVAQATAEGFTVNTQDVNATHWVRNQESLSLVSPRLQNLPLLGLGGTVGTPPEGITAEVLVVSSFEELQASAADAMGKIVVYDEPFTSYGETGDYRWNGAIEAAKVGAVASLIRSVTDFSLATPHTGGQSYEEGVTKIPGAAITIEDASMLHRMYDRGETIVLNLTMNAENLPDVLTRNTIIDIGGGLNPEEIVVVSGHIDSWDVGAGAMDDAAGCIISYMAARAIKQLNLTPRRTYSVVLFVAEEQGFSGDQAYFSSYSDRIRDFQIMMESDMGTFNPRGIGFDGTLEASCIMNEILSLTELLGTTELETTAETPDLGAFGILGVPRGSLANDNENYFWYHHSNADRIEVEDSDTLDRAAALWAAVSYVAADISFRLPHANITSKNEIL